MIPLSNLYPLALHLGRAAHSGWAAHPLTAGALLTLLCVASVGALGFLSDNLGEGGGFFQLPGTPYGDVFGMILYLYDIIGQVAYFLGNLGTVVQAVIDGVNFGFAETGGVFHDLSKWLTIGWNATIGGLITKIMAWLKQLQAWLKKHLAGIIKFLKKVRAWWDRYYRQHILPMINMIQHIRKYLLILRLLHIHWADKLDTYLLKEEQLLNKFFLTTRSFINQALSLATLATNPVSLGRLVLVSAAGRRSMGALCNAITGLQLGHFFPNSSKSAFAFEQQPMRASDYTDIARNPPPSEILSPLLQDFSAGSYEGDYGPEDVDVDGTEHLPWGQQYIDDLFAANAAYEELLYDGFSLTQALDASAGNLYNAGDGSAAAALAFIKS